MESGWFQNIKFNPEGYHTFSTIPIHLLTDRATIREMKKNAIKTNLVSRRKFIRGLGSGFILFGASTCLPHVNGDWSSCEIQDPDEQPIEPVSHRVIEVVSDHAVSDVTYEIDPMVVANMLSAGLAALTEETSLPQAWSRILPSYQEGDYVSLKVNALNPDVPTSPELTAAIAQSLMTNLGVQPDRLFVWDRTELDLLQAGFTPEKMNIACLGTVKSAHDNSGIGYEKQYVCLSGRKIYLSGLLTLNTQHLINAAVLKNHSVAGFTGCLKNHYGSFSNPWDFHKDCDTHIAYLNAIPQVSSTTRLYVIDALLGVVLGDTDRPFDCLPKRILLSFDPVAIDQRGLEIRDEMRAILDRPAGKPADYLQIATELKLGSTDFERVKIDIDA